MTTKPLSEAERMKKVPGIIFIDGPAGRRAHIEGTGLEVFEIIDALRSCHGDRAALSEALETLEPKQLQAALDYYDAFPEEIDDWLAEAAKITPEYLRANFPQSVPIRRPAEAKAGPCVQKGAQASALWPPNFRPG
jgi:uncharacterized protein (DUF433 family)